MTPGHLLGLWQAETVKLLSRLSARIAILCAIVLGFLGPIMLFSIGNSEMVINGSPVAETMNLTAPQGSIWSLNVRNFFLMRAFIIMLAGLSFAGEFSAKTLREDLIRPAPRWAILTAKWGALAAWIALTVLIPWTVANGLGVLAFGLEGDWQGATVGYALTWLTDTAFCSLVLFIATLMRSVAGTIIAVFLFMVFDTLLGWGLHLVAGFSSFVQLPAYVTYIVESHPWFPSAAFGIWSSYAPEEPLMWESCVALVIYTLGSFLLANIAFARTDVP